MMFFALLKMMLLPLVTMMRCLPNVPSGTHHSKKGTFVGRQMFLRTDDITVAVVDIEKLRTS